MLWFILFISTFIIVIHKEISQQIWKLTDFQHSTCKPCDGNFALYDKNYKVCYVVLKLPQIHDEMPTSTDDRCSVMNYTDASIPNTKIFSQKTFYRIFNNLQKEEPAFSNGSMEVLISVKYRRGDGFRWMDGSAPDDLSFLKFNPIDNLDDEDNLIEYHCLHFSIIVNRNAKDGYETKWYECYGKNSIEYVKKSFYLLYSYGKDEEIQEMDGRPKQKECRRDEIPVIINNTYLCYLHHVDTYSLGSIVNDDFDICNEYSNEYGSETERWNQLSPAAVPSKTLLKLLHKEILSVYRQFEKRTHGLMIALTYMHNEYQWKDGISVVYPSLRNLIAGTNITEECSHFMLFQSVPDYIVPVSCNDETITYDILCKYTLDKQPVISKSALIEEIKAMIDQESENDAIKNNAKSNQTSRTNLLITLFFTLITTGIYLCQQKQK